MMNIKNLDIFYNRYLNVFCFRAMEEQFDWKNCQSWSKVQQSCYFPSNPTNSPTLGLQTDWKRLSRAQKTALDVTLFHFFCKEYCHLCNLSISCNSKCEFFLQLLNPLSRIWCMILKNIHNLSTMCCNFDFSLVLKKDPKRIRAKKFFWEYQGKMIFTID